MDTVYVITHNNVEYNDCWYDLDSDTSTNLTGKGFTQKSTAQVIVDGLNLDYIAKGLQVIGQSSSAVEHACNEDAMMSNQRILDRKDYIWNEDHPFIVSIIDEMSIRNVYGVTDFISIGLSLGLFSETKQQQILEALQFPFFFVTELQVQD